VVLLGATALNIAAYTGEREAVLRAIVATGSGRPAGN